jgi:16S rRNA processing protein RimM
LTETLQTFVTLARILRARGTKGEVAAAILTDFPERMASLREVFLSDGTGAPRRAAVRRCWFSHSRGGQAIFHFEGCDSIEAGEKLRGLEVQIPMSERTALPAGRYYVSDLTGCEVFEHVAGGAGETPLGTVRDVEFPGGTPLLAVDTAKGELLIPLAEDICTRIDPAARRIEVALPDGLREINQK